MKALPKPVVHFDVLVQNKLKILTDALALSPQEQRLVAMDSTGKYAGLGEFAESHQTTFAMLRTALLYNLHMQQVVVVGPKMQAAFGHTSLENVPVDRIRLPHPCFYVATPESEGLSLWGGERTGWHSIAGAYVAEDPTENGSLLILAWGSANEKSINALDDATFWFRLDLGRLVRQGNLEREFNRVANSSLLKEVLQTADYEVELLAAAEQLISEGRISSPNAKAAVDSFLAQRRSGDLESTLTRVLDADGGHESSDKGMEFYQRGMTEAHVEQVRESARKLMRIVVNAVLYMNASNADVSEPTTTAFERRRLENQLKGMDPKKSKARELARKIRSISESRIVWVGPKIEASEDADSDFTSGGRRVSGHIRRGHWHTFLSGPRKVEGVVVPKESRTSTLKWVPPLWVGSAKKSVGKRVYGIRGEG